MACWTAWCRTFVFCFLALCVSCPLILCQIIEMNLGGNWVVQNANRSIAVYGNVPGNIHTALYNNGTIMNPYFRFNDVVYRWVAYDNWTYSRDVEVSEDLLSKKQILMVFEGLDTIATVVVNKLMVGQSDNMFHRYTFDVRPAMKVGLNSIEVRFTSAVLFAKEKSQKYSYPVPPKCPVPVQRGECHGNFIRKEQCSFSWDWGPAFVTQGIWRNIFLQAYNSAVIRDIVATPLKGKGGNGITWQLMVAVFVDAAEDGVTGTLLLSLPELSHSEKLPVKLSHGLQKVSFPTLSFTEGDNVLVWWPQGYGKPNLYTVKVVFVSSSSIEQSDITRRIGFKKVKLKQESIGDSPGLGFHFEINDLPIFMKGANWIPADAFEDRVTAPVLRNLLQSAVDANMNVLRNWGGGIYQHDEFYDIADELGLLVWEEFMFACAMYPTDEEFLKSVQEEIRYQVRRLQHHASIMTWSGNNENEVALADNWYNTSSQSARYVKDYVRLYIDTIRETLEQEDSSRPFLSSSPSNGVETEKEGWVAKNPQSPYWGDVHFYDYHMDCWNVSAYPKPRFASEYGFQSYPSFETLAEVSIKEDWSFDSEFMDHRQHHADGNKQMLDQAKKHFKLPTSSDPLKRFKDTLFITQVAQAQCMKMETEHYRRLQSEIVQGKGRTMGTIYWQLNSIWQAPTWSSLEYGGRWKLLHYFVKNFYSPVIVSAYQEGGKFKLYVISDLVKPITNGSVVMKAWSWSSLSALHVVGFQFSIDRQSSIPVYVDDMKDVLRQSGCESPQHCVLTMKPVDLTSGKDLGPTNVFYPSSLSEAVGLTNPNLKIDTISKISQTQFIVVIRAQFPACLVWLNAGNIRGRFSDNGFLQTEDIKKVTFYSWENTTLTELRKNLHVSSLYDLYT